MVKKVSIRLLLIFAVVAFIAQSFDLGAQVSYRFEPYLSNPKENGITIAWVCTTEVSAEVAYGLTTEYGSMRSVDTIIHSDFNPSFDSLKYESDIYIHKVRLTGLQPGEKYYYKIVSSDVPDFTSHFHTVSTDPDLEILYGFGGDHNRTMPEKEEMEFIENLVGKEMDFYLDLGDFSINCLKRFRQEWSSRIPVLVARGNHDNNDQTVNETSWREYPAPVGHLQHFWDFDDDRLDYSLTWGPAFIVVSGSVIYKPLPQKKVDWIVQEYENSDSPLKIFMNHGVFFIDNTKHGKEGPDRVAQMWPIFNEQNVDLVYHGHSHNYQRSYRINEHGVRDSNGTINVNLGGTDQDFEDGFSPWNAKSYFGLPNAQKIIGFTHVKDGLVKTQVWYRTDDDSPLKLFDEFSFPLREVSRENHYTR